MSLMCPPFCPAGLPLLSSSPPSSSRKPRWSSPGRTTVEWLQSPLQSPAGTEPAPASTHAPLASHVQCTCTCTCTYACICIFTCTVYIHMHPNVHLHLYLWTHLQQDFHLRLHMRLHIAQASASAPCPACTCYSLACSLLLTSHEQCPQNQNILKIVCKGTRKQNKWGSQGDLSQSVQIWKETVQHRSS